MSLTKMLRRARLYKANREDAELRDALAEVLAYNANEELEERKRSAIEYADRVTANPHQCRYGHLNCADSTLGECSDEILSNAGL